MDNPSPKNPNQTLFGFDFVENKYLPENIVAMRNGTELVIINTDTGKSFKITESEWRLPRMEPKGQCETIDSKGNYCPLPATLRTGKDGGSFYACDSCWRKLVWELRWRDFYAQDAKIDLRFP